MNSEPQEASKSVVTLTQAAQQLGISADTIRRWSKLGLIKAGRDARNRRVFNVEEIARIQRKYQHGVRSAKPRHEMLVAQPTLLTSVELFAGAGGTALGMHNAGFQHILLNEIDIRAAQTLEQNMPDWQVAREDIHAMDFRQWRGQVDLLQGGVPCQAFSYAGKSLGFADTRGTLFFEFARAIEHMQPRVIMMENVRGLLSHDHGRTLHTMLCTFQSLGYRVAAKLLRAQFFDVPQKRERLVILGVRQDLDLPLMFPREQDYMLTLWDAIGDCPPSAGEQYSSQKREVLKLVPPGGYWRDLPEAVQRAYMGKSWSLPGGKTGMARRLSWDEPSLTLTCSPAQKQTERCHPDQTRPLSVREYARIQTFPDDWEFAGSMSAQYRQIGNAVPVNLAFHIGMAIRAMLTGEHADMQQFKVAQPLQVEAEFSEEQARWLAASVVQ